jgi:hypothetical protein
MTRGAGAAGSSRAEVTASPDGGGALRRGDAAQRRELRALAHAPGYDSNVWSEHLGTTSIQCLNRSKSPPIRAYPAGPREACFRWIPAVFWPPAEHRRMVFASRRSPVRSRLAPLESPANRDLPRDAETGIKPGIKQTGAGGRLIGPGGRFFAVQGPEKLSLFEALL